MVEPTSPFWEKDLHWRSVEIVNIASLAVTALTGFCSGHILTTAGFNSLDRENSQCSATTELLVGFLAVCDGTWLTQGSTLQWYNATQKLMHSACNDSRPAADVKMWQEQLSSDCVAMHYFSCGWWFLQGATYFLLRTDPLVTLLVVFEVKKVEKDSSVTQFMTNLAAELRCTRQFATLRPGHK